jgi:hypothetical protein
MGGLRYMGVFDPFSHTRGQYQGRPDGDLADIVPRLDLVYNQGV